MVILLSLLGKQPRQTCTRLLKCASEPIQVHPNLFQKNMPSLLSSPPPYSSARSSEAGGSAPASLTQRTGAGMADTSPRPCAPPRASRLFHFRQGQHANLPKVSRRVLTADRCRAAAHSQARTHCGGDVGESRPAEPSPFPVPAIGPVSKPTAPNRRGKGLGEMEQSGGNRHDIA